MLGYIAKCCPISSRNTIVKNSTSLTEIWQSIRLNLGFQSNGSHFLDFMTSLSDVKQAEIIEAFKSTSRYLDDLLNIDNPYFEGMVNRIYPPELQLNKANTADTEAPFLDLHLSISNGFVSSKIYDKRDDFDFDIVNFPFLDGDVPSSTSYGVYISQLIRFASV